MTMMERLKKAGKSMVDAGAKTMLKVRAIIDENGALSFVWWCSIKELRCFSLGPITCEKMCFLKLHLLSCTHFLLSRLNLNGMHTILLDGHCVFRSRDQIAQTSLWD
jgi:hypothetical protein